MAEDDTQRSLGRLEAVQETHDQRLSRIESKIDHLVMVMDQAKGGWKMLMAAGAAGAAAMGIGAKFVAMLMGKG